MMELRRSEDRGRGRFGWLDSHHTFSFGSYFDPEQMGCRSLRVINDDRVTPGAGFPTHPHRDMEIISYVVTGALEHRDSLGNGSVIVPGDLQRMTAGTGVTHSEFNPSSVDGVRFLQIWIVPDRKGLEPGYEQRNFSLSERTNALRLVASKDGREGSVTVNQDVCLYASVLEPGASTLFEGGPDRHVWLQMIRGAIEVNGTAMAEGDGLHAGVNEALELEARETAEFLLFDLA